MEKNGSPTCKFPIGPHPLSPGNYLFFGGLFVWFPNRVSLIPKADFVWLQLKCKAWTCTKPTAGIGNVALSRGIIEIPCDVTSPRGVSLVVCFIRIITLLAAKVVEFDQVDLGKRAQLTRSMSRRMRRAPPVPSFTPTPPPIITLNITAFSFRLQLLQPFSPGSATLDFKIFYFLFLFFSLLKP